MKSPLVDYGSQFVAYGLFGYVAMAGVLQLQSLGAMSVEVASYLALAIGMLMAFKIIVDIFMIDEKVSPERRPIYTPARYSSPHGPLPA